MICSRCQSKIFIGPQTWAESIRERRLVLGYSLQSFAPDVGCSFAHLAKIERGETPSPRLRASIEEALSMAEE